MARHFIERALSRTKQDRSTEENQKKSPRAAPRVFAVTPSLKMLGFRRLVYDDTDVCRLLGVRRRVLVAARTQNARGVDWDCVGQHAGMTDAWIRARGGDPSGLTPIEPGDGIVTVTAASRVANVQVMVCFKVTGGSRAVVLVKDSRMIRLGDQFDCRYMGTKLYLDPSINPEVY